MIAHDFQCAKGHTFERFVRSDEARQRCRLCKGMAERVFLPRRGRVGNLRPTVVYINAKGEKLYPGNGDKLPDKLARGYERVEIQPHEIRRFEKQVSAEMAAKHAQEQEEYQRDYEAERDERHSDLRSQMNQMDDFHRGLALEAVKDESRGYSHNYDPEFHIGAWS